MATLHYLIVNPIEGKARQEVVLCCCSSNIGPMGWIQPTEPGLPLVGMGNLLTLAAKWLDDSRSAGSLSNTLGTSLALRFVPAVTAKHG